MQPRNFSKLSVAVAAALLCTTSLAHASSHREGLAIGATPKVDNTDVYAFNSYEAGRSGFVTIIANFLPFQDPGGGPHYYPLDDQATYTIKVDNDGDAMPDLTFAFEFENTFKNIAVDVGGVSVPIPILNPAPIGPNAADTAALDRVETYGISVWREDRNRGDAVSMSAAPNMQFVKPVDNIGNKTIPAYEAYARQHIYALSIPGCAATGGRVFVGQRKEGFVVNVGEIFDLVNLNPLGPVDGKPNALENKNITSIAMEIPKACLTTGNEPVIGIWSTVTKSNITVRRLGNEIDRGAPQQVSRLGMALVNEVVIGNPDKDTFNASPPTDDGRFLNYVTNPVLPELLEALFGVRAPNVFPRTDLVTVFLTGVPGLNQPANVVPSEMLRLNTTTPAAPAAVQNPLGVIGGDVAGYPNGRRPGDDVVDISLRVAMGVLLTPAQAPDGRLPYTDQAYVDARMFDEVFPYLLSPLPGSPVSAAIEDPSNP